MSATLAVHRRTKGIGIMRLTTALLRRASQATITWGIIFTVVHVYWAFGGGDGLNESGDASLGASLYIGFIALLGLIGTIVAYGLSQPAGDDALQRRLHLLARTGGIALLLGVVVGVSNWIADGSIGDDGIAGIVITAYFLVGGALYTLLGWSDRGLPARRPSPRPAALRVDVAD